MDFIATNPTASFLADDVHITQGPITNSLSIYGTAGIFKSNIQKNTLIGRRNYKLYSGKLYAINIFE